jgi:hypothetical protein
MTIGTKIHGYTAWINMRLEPYDHCLNNVLMDLLKGTNMKYLLQGYTGRENDKLTSFDKYSFIRIISFKSFE